MDALRIMSGRPDLRAPRGPHRAINWLVTALPKAVAVVALHVIMFLTVADISLRHLRGRGITGTLEYGEALLVILAFTSLAVTQRSGGHVGLDVAMKAVRRRAPMVGRWLLLIGALPAIVLVAWLVTTTTSAAIDSYTSGEYRYGPTRLVLWPIRGLAAAGLLFLAIELVRTALGEFRGDLPLPGDEAGQEGRASPTEETTRVFRSDGGAQDSQPTSGRVTQG